MQHNTCHCNSTCFFFLLTLIFVSQGFVMYSVQSKKLLSHHVFQVISMKLLSFTVNPCSHKTRNDSVRGKEV